MNVILLCHYTKPFFYYISFQIHFEAYQTIISKIEKMSNVVQGQKNDRACVPEELI